MKILTIGPWFSPHTQRPIRWLCENGFEVCFLGDNNPFPTEMPGYSFSIFPNTNDVIEAISRLQSIYNQFRPDVVHVHWIDARAWLCVQAGLKPLVLSVWGSDINDFFIPGCDTSFRLGVGETLSGADLTIIDAPTMAHKCSVLAGKEIATTFLHLGFDTSRFNRDYEQAASNWRERLKINQDAVVLLSPRGWGANNGHHKILEAFNNALPKFENDAVLLFKIYNRISFADNLIYEMEIRRRAIELGISDKIRWMENVPDNQVPEIFAASDIVINYPKKDTLPITLMEAAASGCCTITALLPSYLETFIEHHLRCFTPGCDDELVAAMIELVNMSPLQRKTLALGAQQEVINCFDEKMYIDGITNIYKALANGKVKNYTKYNLNNHFKNGNTVQKNAIWQNFIEVMLRQSVDAYLADNNDFTLDLLEYIALDRRNYTLSNNYYFLKAKVLLALGRVDEALAQMRKGQIVLSQIQNHH